MTDPTRPEASSSSHKADPDQNPPRPPNAWILYRSDKLKALPSPEPGMPRKPQADISKIISSMWRMESTAVRSEYEHLSEVKKAEHHTKYPHYRFQPKKKSEKDRIRAEKQAMKERARKSRKQNARSRRGIAPAPQPLFTTEARFGPAGPSPPASGSSTPPTSLGGGQFQFTIHSQPMPPANRPTPPTNHPTPSASTSAVYPPPPVSASFPSLAAPQPGVPQRPPSASDWQPRTHEQQQQDRQTQQFNSLWLDTGSQLPPPENTNHPQEYLHVPVPNQPSQQPLGWSLDDPAPLTDPAFFQSNQDNQPLQAVLDATDDPNVFDISGLDFRNLFDGSQDIEVTFGVNRATPFDPNSFSMLENLLGPWEPPVDLQLDQNAAGSSSRSFLNGPYDTSRSSSGTLGFDSYSLENYVDDVQHSQYEEEVIPLEQVQNSIPQDDNKEDSVVLGPFVPPTGAGNSARRVAADWRHTIRRTPEPEVTREVVWSSLT
ncbi:hypothetical protein BU17DRAFT_65397 [Hysterangium stoloniferum]|nr:hypothetical protein BU17DRAFT_65397 [Hysterangium stoloniferum]